MEKIISNSLLATAILLMVTILLQQRGASLGSAFGGSSSVYRSRRGAEKWLFIVTIILAIIFIGLSIAALAIQ